MCSNYSVTTKALDFVNLSIHSDLLTPISFRDWVPVCVTDPKRIQGYVNRSFVHRWSAQAPAIVSCFAFSVQSLTRNKIPPIYWLVIYRCKDVGRGNIREPLIVLFLDFSRLYDDRDFPIISPYSEIMTELVRFWTWISKLSTDINRIMLYNIRMIFFAEYPVFIPSI